MAEKGDRKSDGNNSTDDENFESAYASSNKFAGLDASTKKKQQQPPSTNHGRVNLDDDPSTTVITNPARPSAAAGRKPGSRGDRRRSTTTTMTTENNNNWSPNVSTTNGTTATTKSTAAIHCPFDIRKICSTCFNNGGTISYQDGNYCSNRRVKHIWFHHKGFAIFDKDDCGKPYKVNPLPSAITRNITDRVKVYVRLCNPQVRRGHPNKCEFNPCHFAHSELERRCWIWMAETGKKLGDVATNGPLEPVMERKAPTQLQPMQPAAAPKAPPVTSTAAAPPPPAPTKSFSSALENRPLPSVDPRPANLPPQRTILLAVRRQQAHPPPPQPTAPPTVPTTISKAQLLAELEDELDDDGVFYCYLCGKSVDDYDSFDDHVKTEMHRERYRLVEENRIWKYRAPPRAPPLKLCESHLREGKCVYSSTMHNRCTDAHSTEELDEWSERLEHMERALERKGSTEILELRTKIEEARKAGKSVLTPCVDYASITCDGNKAAAMTKKGDGFKWKFTMMVTGVTRLRRVILLNQETSMYFRLRSPFVDTPNEEILPGDVFADHGVPGFYQIGVEFIGSKTAQTFTQRIAFDFQRWPIVYEEVTVYSGLDRATVIQQACLRSSLKLVKDRWTPENSEIHWISKTRPDPRMDISNVVANLNFTVNESNYFPLLKQWLYAELYKRQSLLDEMSLKNVTITAAPYVMDDDEERYYAPRDDIGLAVVPLNDPLSEDVDVISLLREYCTHAFISPTLTQPLKPGEKRRVFEVEVINRVRFRHQGVFSDRIHLQLSSTLVKHFGLRPGSKLTVDIQFNFFDKQFQRWLHALDYLRNRQLSSLIFPDLMAYFPDYASGKVMAKTKEKILAMPHMLALWKKEHNAEERDVLGHVLSCALDRNTWVPPLVVFGAFGTGKTRTLASAAATLLMHKEFEHTKILICTHANTTADMYIRLLLELTKFSKDRLAPILWRVFNSRKKPEYEDFIRTTYDNQSRQMRAEPLTLAKLRQMRVVISTFEASDKLLKDLKLRGHTAEDIDKVAFTHIFIDEAAQAMELETVMPLCLAKRSTCIVVAGDHHQIRPHVYLPEAKELGRSYLERLWYYYDQEKASMEKSIPANVRMNYRIPSVLFNKNYRCHRAILSFISEEFYGDPDCLTSLVDFPDCPYVKPMNFVVSESDEEIGRNGAIINRQEAKDVADQVEFLWNHWPRAWGERNIGVAIPYVDHGRIIRAMLKNRGINSSSSGLDISRVIQMQGKEYKALVISTVRGPKQLVESGGGNLNRNLGFLDDARLINTAMTRAKYSVIVVGNPYVLCSLGSCREIWYRYIWRCAHGGGELLPHTITWPNVDEKIKQYRTRFASVNTEKLAETTSDTDVLVQQLTRKTQREMMAAFATARK